jgi:hypothetical protein
VSQAAGRGTFRPTLQHGLIGAVYLKRLDERMETTGLASGGVEASGALRSDPHRSGQPGV